MGFEAGLTHIFRQIVYSNLCTAGCDAKLDFNVHRQRNTYEFICSAGSVPFQCLRVAILTSTYHVEYVETTPIAISNVRARYIEQHEIC